MATYEYQARDENGNIFNGIYEDIANIAKLKEEISKIGYALISAKKKRSLAITSRKIRHSEVVEFAFKFAGMSTAGLSIIQCLDTLEKQTENPAFRAVIADIQKNVEMGSSLTDAFEKHRDLFSDFFLGMIEAGESGGKLAESLNVSATYLEKQDDLKNKLKSAFTYPIIVGVMCVVIITILVIFIVPVFSKIYSQLGVSLPGPTQTLILLSVVMRGYWHILLIIAAVSAFLIKRFSKNVYIRSKWDIFKFKMPIFGKLNKMVTVANFIRSFAMLSSTGVPIIKSIQVATLVANNWQVSEISSQLQKSIQAGQPIAESFAEHDLFPPIIIQLATSGEEAGVLGQMLNKGVDFLEKDITREINAMLVKLEPALTMGLGIVIGLILMAVYLPMFDYMSHLK